jgi:Transcriptional Coactivator p15 (PC4)
MATDDDDEEPKSKKAKVDDDDDEGEGEDTVKVQRNDQGEAFFELSRMRRITVRKFKGTTLVDIREVCAHILSTSVDDERISFGLL